MVLDANEGHMVTASLPDCGEAAAQQGCKERCKL